MPKRNRLLANLTDEEIESLAPHLEEVSLAHLEVLYRPDELIQHVHFVRRGVVSIVKETAAGMPLELSVVGFEGMAGLPVALGVETASEQAYVQVPGNAVRMQAQRFRQAVEEIPNLQRTLGRYAVVLLNQFAQEAACNRTHSVEQRCARLLLRVHDAMQEKTFPLTHQFLAQMVSAQRPTVSLSASSLQKAGLIKYTRGVVTINNRRGLEAVSCKCHSAVRAEYERLLE